MQRRKLALPSVEHDDDLDERLETTFARDTPNPAVCVADGFGVRVGVDRGRLVVVDGLGLHRRERRYSKATHGLARLVVLSSAGVVSLESLRWCAGAGIGVVVLDPFGGGLHLTSGGTGNDDPRLRRAQALAVATPAGMDITRYLVGAKLAGQASVVRDRLGQQAAASTIAALAEELGRCGALEDCRQVEATAANVYWNAWESLVVQFVRKDAARVPDHWRCFEGRRSAVGASGSRSATDPVNALLNYVYRLLEAEGRLACLAIGLDPGLGILHADVRGRDSMVLDIMEPARPDAERFVLELLAMRPLMRTDFAEDRRGLVRVLPPLTHRVAEAMPGFASLLGPLVEHVAGLLARVSPYDPSVPSVLTGSKHRQAARRRVDGGSAARGPDRGPSQGGPNPGGLPSRGKTRQRPPSISLPSVPARICRGCGAELPVDGPNRRTERTWCDACFPSFRKEVDQRMNQGGRLAAEQVRAATGSLPSHSAEAQARRRRANMRQLMARLAWEDKHEDVPDAEWYLANIAPKLLDVSLPAIAAATGVSTSAASKFRRGLRVPSPRHWEKLAQLVGLTGPAPV
jgi:CRISPR-associated endonuclease Cas1